MTLRKFVSGGQTGVDRAALDVAIACELEHGGWCPRGRIAEDGRIGNEYNLQETISRKYATRTEQNVVDSDATLIIFSQQISGGTSLTMQLAKKHHREMLPIDISACDNPGFHSENGHRQMVQMIATWISSNNIAVLNVAGPRESNCPGIGLITQNLLTDVLAVLRAQSNY